MSAGRVQRRGIWRLLGWSVARNTRTGRTSGGRLRQAARLARQCTAPVTRTPRALSHPSPGCQARSGRGNLAPPSCIARPAFVCDGVRKGTTTAKLSDQTFREFPGSRSNHSWIFDGLDEVGIPEATHPFHDRRERRPRDVWGNASPATRLENWKDFGRDIRRIARAFTRRAALIRLALRNQCRMRFLARVSLGPTDALLCSCTRGRVGGVDTSWGCV